MARADIIVAQPPGQERRDWVSWRAELQAGHVGGGGVGGAKRGRRGEAGSGALNREVLQGLRLQSVRCLQILRGLGALRAAGGSGPGVRLQRHPVCMKLSPALPGTVSAPTPDRSPPCFPDSGDCLFQPDMDVLPMCSIFQELQIVHETGYFSALPSLEEYWQQVNTDFFFPFTCPVRRGGSRAEEQARWCVLGSASF